MQKMIRIFDISFGYHPEISFPEQVPILHREGLGYADFLKNQMDITIIKHINYEGEMEKDGVRFRFFRSGRGFFHGYLKTIHYIKREKPELVFVQGLLFPFQVIILHMIAGKKIRIIAQHHGERPFTGLKKIFQRLADRYIHAYLFTSLGNAIPWLEAGIIKDRAKCQEILEGSTDFIKQNKQISRKKLQVSGSPIILWVGRLNSNKDPLTVLKGFKKFQGRFNSVRMYMIFHEDDLLEEVKNFIGLNAMYEQIHLIGKIPHLDLKDWFSAADIFISGSHMEGSGFALLEAMACGCIPVVTAIPSFITMTGKGLWGFLYEPGNENKLFDALMLAQEINLETFPNKLKNYFNEELSFASIAEKLYTRCMKLIAE